MEAAIKTFFTSPHFAVVGASPSPEKYGYKVLSWYLKHSLPVQPVNPRVPTILDTPTIAALSDLADPKNTSVSFITPPTVTKQLLEDAVKLGVRRVWLQPGSWEGDGLLEGLREKGVVVVAGGGNAWGEGACVLVHGEEGLGSRERL